MNCINHPIYTPQEQFKNLSTFYYFISVQTEAPLKKYCWNRRRDGQPGQPTARRRRTKFGFISRHSRPAFTILRLRRASGHPFNHLSADRMQSPSAWLMTLTTQLLAHNSPHDHTWKFPRQHGCAKLFRLPLEMRTICAILSGK